MFLFGSEPHAVAQLRRDIPIPAIPVDQIPSGWYDGGMKTKTSVTLSEDVLRLIDENAKGEKNRSAFIEAAVRAYLEVVRRHGRDRDDLSIINRLAEKLNSEASDVLSYQAEL